MGFSCFNDNLFVLTYNNLAGETWANPRSLVILNPVSGLVSPLHTQPCTVHTYLHTQPSTNFPNTREGGGGGLIASDRPCCFERVLCRGVPWCACRLRPRAPSL